MEHLNEAQNENGDCEGKNSSTNIINEQSVDSDVNVECIRSSHNSSAVNTGRCTNQNTIHKKPIAEDGVKQVNIRNGCEKQSLTICVETKLRNTHINVESSNLNKVGQNPLKDSCSIKKDDLCDRQLQVTPSCSAEISQKAIHGNISGIETLDRKGNVGIPPGHSKDISQKLELHPHVDRRRLHHMSNSSLDDRSVCSSTSERSSHDKLLQKPANATTVQSFESRPIYPNIPYSPYGSPHSNRRRTPLRESRRISIEQSGSFLQLNQYKLLDQIGQGSYGLVKLAYSEEDATHYAMKILSKRRLLRQAGLLKRGPKKAVSPLDRVYREIAVLKKLDHPNVVKLVEVLDDPMEDSLYMVFELVKQGEVLTIPTDKPLSEERVWNVFRDTLLGLEYLHYQRIIHADIKPGNLLLTEDGHVKIADLGVCNEFFGDNATMSNIATAGTPAFRPPETLNIGQNLYCGKAADIWALGITLYSLIFGNVPFVANTVLILYDKIKNEEFAFPSTPEISSDLKDCIQQMLVKDPTKRITMKALKEHSWVTSGNKYPLPSEDENCRAIQVSDDDINSVVRSIPKLDTLILIKTMLRKHSFGNPFTRAETGRTPHRGCSRLERFARCGRSNSAPGSYNLVFDKQLSGENLLPSLSEQCPNSTNEES